MAERDAETLALVERARAGDEEAFAGLVHRYADRLHRYLQVEGLDAADAEDCVQEAFIRAHGAIARYDARYAFTTWLYAIARRLAIDLRRRRGRERRVPLEAASDASGAAEGPELAEEAPIWALARRSLPEKQFSALWLFYGEDCDVRETARALGVTAVHARVLLHRARARLGELLRATVGDTTTCLGGGVR